MASRKKTAQTRKRSRPVQKNKPTIDTNIIIVIVLAAVIISAIGLFVVFGGQGNDEENDNDNNQVSTENPIAIIDTSMGTITVELYQDKTPNTVDNFIKYAESGFYDGLVFHRVIDGFVIQGGGFEPDGTYKQPLYDPIDLEIHEDLEHVDGAVSMARTSDPDSATSQFFINDGPQPNLEPGRVDPNGYAVFGQVTDGMDVVRDISAVETTTKNGMQDWPVENVIINSVTIQQ